MSVATLCFQEWEVHTSDYRNGNEEKVGTENNTLLLVSLK
jgi:hypothetical protein